MVCPNGFEVSNFSELRDDGEQQVTLQIGMVCSDGFAIVGDTWKHVPSSGRQWFGYMGSKLIMSPSRKALAAVARNVDVASDVVAEAFAQLEEGCEGRIDRIKEISSRIAQDHEIECFVIFTQPQPEMYLFQKDKRSPTRCELMYGCYPLGDAGNPAYYWAIRYCDTGKTVEQFVRIGALVVVEGARFNNAIIQGLEVATLDKQGLRIWDRKESDSLKSEIDVLDEEISALVQSIPHPSTDARQSPPPALA
jgi:hypothetical protein